MIYEYHGFTVHRLEPRRFYATGYGFRWFAASVIEAVNLINGYIAGQCDF